MATGSTGRRAAMLAFWSIAAIFVSPVSAQPITTDIHVKLRPVLEKIDLVTDINIVDQSLFVCTQPGLLVRTSLAPRSTPDFTVFLDLHNQVGALGSRIPALEGLGYPTPGTYDERGLLGFAADPAFTSN